MWEIFKEYGIDTDALGPVRIMKFQQFVNDCAKRGNGFKNHSKWSRKNGKDDETAANKHFESLENEVAYLRQVVEFLKKYVRQIRRRRSDGN